MRKSRDVRVPQLVAAGHGPKLARLFGANKLPEQWEAIDLPESASTPVATITLEMKHGADHHQLELALPYKVPLRNRDDLETKLRMSLTPSNYRVLIACFAAVEEDFALGREEYGTFQFYPARMLRILGGEQTHGGRRNSTRSVDRVRRSMDTLSRMALKVDMQLGRRRIVFESKALLTRNDSVHFFSEHAGSDGPQRGRGSIERIRLAENLISFMKGPSPIYVSIPPDVIRCPEGTHERRWSEAFLVYVELLSHARRKAARAAEGAHPYARSLDGVSGASNRKRTFELLHLLGSRHLVFKVDGPMIRYDLPSARPALDRIASRSRQRGAPSRC